MVPCLEVLLWEQLLILLPIHLPTTWARPGKYQALSPHCSSF